MSAAPADRPVAEAFRDVMARVCTPVSIVTTVVDGRPHGTTVSAFNSLSMDPPMVLVSLDRSSDLLRDIRDSGRFGVNVLGDVHVPAAQTFARKGATKFDAVDWHLADGLPRLPMALGWLACDVANLVDGGDHVIVLGLVRVADGDPEVQPLTYFSRRFGTHSVLPGAG